MSEPLTRRGRLSSEPNAPDDLDASTLPARKESSAAVKEAPPPFQQLALPVRSRARYELLGEHGRGGLGRVLVARDRELERMLALKELLVPDDDSRLRFMREALITSRLQHPAIVPVYEAGRWESGELFYAMKLVSGRTLKEALEDRRTLEERLSLLPNLIAVADAVAYAHQQGIIHRDLKASNVLIGNFGETVVIDWGLARDVRAPLDSSDERGGPAHSPPQASLTVAGAVIGTPAFMPPEQARGEEVDERADVYALGALLYYCISGEAPHANGSANEVLELVRTQPARPIERLQPRIPADLAAIINKAMCWEREQRYRDAQQLAQDLKRFQTGQMVSAHEYSWAQLLARQVRRHRALALSAALFLLLALVGTTAFVLREQRLRQRAEAERDRADQKTLTLLEQQGREELSSGRPLRASAFLSEALLRNPSSLALRSLLTQTLRPLESHERSLAGHTHDVVAVAYSPSGELLATASTDTTARLWLARTGQPLHVLRGHTAGLDCIAFSPDGALVATGAGDKAVRLWRADTGELLRVLEDRDAYRLSFTPDGRRLFTGGHDGEVRLWDIPTGQLLMKAQPHQDRIFAMAYSPDGTRMAVGSWDGVVSVWDVASARVVQRLEDHEDKVSSVAYSHDGRWLLTGESNVYVHVRDARTGARVHLLRMPEHARFPLVSFSPDDQAVIVRAQDGGVRILHAASGALLVSLDAQPFGKLFHSAVGPGGEQLATVGHAGSVHLWNLRRLAGYRLLSQGEQPRRAVYPSVYSRDGSRILGGSPEGTLTLWEAASGARLRSLKSQGSTYSVALGANDSRAAASTIHHSIAPSLWDMHTGQRVAELTGHERMAYNLAASADGTLVATASYDGHVRLFDMRTGEPRGRLPVGDKRLTAVTFSPGGEHVAVTDEDGSLFILERATGQVLRSWRAHDTWVEDIEYSRDGARIVTAGRQDHTARVWEAATGEKLLTLEAHRDNMIQASFSPDGRLIATSGMDHTAHVWDASTGELLRTMVGPSYTAAFSPDGRELLTSGYFGYAAIWELTLDRRSPEELARVVAERSPWRLVEGRLERRRRAD